MTTIDRLTVDDAASGERLDRFLVRTTTHWCEGSVFSRATIQRLIEGGQIRVNGRSAKPGTRLRTDDVLWFSLKPASVSALLPEPLALEILYEDDDIIVINKAAGMVVHPGAGQQSGTLVHALLHHCPTLEGIGGERRPGIVHRLDKDTSGVLVAVKNDLSYAAIARQFKERTVRKEYKALVWGKLVPKEGTIERAIGRHRTDRKKMSSLRHIGKVRPAVTIWRVDEYFENPLGSGEFCRATLVTLYPKTGRTHQIRVHLSDAGFPIVGDRVYARSQRPARSGEKALSLLTNFTRQALHATALELEHPRSGDRLRFHAPLPDDIAMITTDLRSLGATSAVPMFN